MKTAHLDITGAVSFDSPDEGMRAVDVAATANLILCRSGLYGKDLRIARQILEHGISRDEARSELRRLVGGMPSRLYATRRLARIYTALREASAGVLNVH